MPALRVDHNCEEVHAVAHGAEDEGDHEVDRERVHEVAHELVQVVPVDEEDLVGKMQD